jgi:hypothetical protein
MPIAKALKMSDFPSLLGPINVVVRAIGIFRAVVMLRKFSTVSDTSCIEFYPGVDT